MNAFKSTVLALGMAVAAPAAMAAHVTSFGFACYTNNSGSCSSYASQLNLDVYNNGDGTVGFQFINNITSVFTGDAARITTLYFDTSGIASMAVGAAVGTVSYAADTPLGAPPGSGASWANAATDFQFAPTQPQNVNSIQSGESLVIVGTLLGGFTYADLIASFNTGVPPTGATRIGLHLQSVGLRGENSEGLYATLGTTVIPVPGALPLMLSGLVGLGLLARRRRSMN